MTFVSLVSSLSITAVILLMPKHRAGRYSTIVRLIESWQNNINHLCLSMDDGIDGNNISSICGPETAIKSSFTNWYLLSRNLQSWFELWDFAQCVFLWYSAGLGYWWTEERDFIKDGRGLALLVKTKRNKRSTEETIFFNPWWVIASCICYCCWAATRWLVSTNLCSFSLTGSVQNFKSIFDKLYLWGGNGMNAFFSVDILS